MIDDSLLPFSLPSVDRKKITAAFDGGRISSDGGVMLLALAERRMGIAARLAAEIIDRRDPTRIVHGLPDILRARMCRPRRRPILITETRTAQSSGRNRVVPAAAFHNN